MKRKIPSNTRRSFIKKSFLGGLFICSGWPLIASIKSDEIKKKTFHFQHSKHDYSSINWKEIRAQFPVTNDRKYFNTGSLGPSPQVVIDKVCQNTQLFESAGSEGRSKIKLVREKFADFLNAETEEISFTRNTTEGMNIAARSLPLIKGDEILLTDQEHIGGSAPWLALEKDIGVKVKQVKLDLSGKKNLEILKSSIGPKTKIISFSHVTCTTGMVLPAKEIVDLCRERNIFSVVDGAQSIGLIPIDLKAINPDIYAGSGHKWLYGPSGTGIFYMNRSIIDQCSPNHVGAYTDSKFDLASLSLEYRMTTEREEYGTRNTPLIYGLESALDFIEELGLENIIRRREELANYFLSFLEKNQDVEVLSPEDKTYRTPIITLRIKGVDSLQSAPLLNLNHKLRVRGIYESNLNAFRISFSIFNTKSEIELLTKSLLALQ